MTPHRPSHTLGYAEFGTWYDGYRSAVLETALSRASSALTQQLAEELSDRDLARIRMTTGRVKSKRRTWRKIHQPRYQGRILSAGDVPAVIDDLVGLRVTCVNLRDNEAVQAAIHNLPHGPGKGSDFWLEPNTERDYVVEPKESGYRGWHVNLGTTVEVAGHPTQVTCELQVRTLLQDSWGELTHEDTYSSDGNLPPLVAILSTRMADLLATLDDIAEDLRTELDRIDDAAVAEVDELSPGSAAVLDIPTEQAADAAALVLSQWRDLERPIDLASLAWTLQREFGRDVSDDWFGHRSFKRFVRYAVPEGEISIGRQAYLLPAGYQPDAERELPDEVTDAEPRQTPDEIVDIDAVEAKPLPAAAHQLRRIDRSFPLLATDEWQHLFEQLSSAWQRLGEREPSNRMINQLTRSARDRSAGTGAALSRRNLDYVAKIVVGTDETTAPLGAEGIADAFAAATLDRMTELRILDPKSVRARRAVERWLRGH